MLRWIEARREARRRIEKDARDLLTFMGDNAYAEARVRAREHREKSDRQADRHWGKVAVEIARRTGHVIGESTADRFLASAAAERDRPKRNALAGDFIEIAEAIRELACGLALEATTLHNAEAAVHRLVDLSRSAEAEKAGRELRLLGDLANSRAESEASIADGMYPARVEKAALALQRLRGVALPPQ